MFAVCLVLICISCVSSLGVTSILEAHEEHSLHPDLEPLITEIILRSINVNDLSCLALLCDETYQDVFGKYFFNKMIEIPFFKILVNENEDLLSPNYGTLSTLRRVRQNGCKTYVVLLSNGDRSARLLRFGDRYRELDTRANFILLYDQRLLQPEIYYLWKKLVNIIFIRRFKPRAGALPWYELSTVPFPAPVGDILIPRRLDTWRSGKFYSNTELFRDKTSDLRKQALKVVTFQHVPAAFKMPAPAVSRDITLEGTQSIGYAGLEIEVLETLSRIMNFVADVYDVGGDEKWGTQQINGSYSGLLGEVVSGRADLALGDLHYTPYYLNLMDLTIPYNTQCLTFLTPESLTDNSWKILILPFRGYLWTGVLISLASAGVVFFALAKFHRALEGGTTTPRIIHVQTTQGFQLTKMNNLMHSQQMREGKTDDELIGLYQFEHMDNSFLYTYSMLLLVSLPKLPAGWSLRVFTGWWWIFCILVVVAYRASMTAILANPVPRVTIDTLEQLAESRIPVGGWGEEIRRFFQTSLDTAGKKIGSKFEVVYDVEAAVERVAKGEFAFYENIYFLKYSAVRRQVLAMEEIQKTSKDVDTNGSMETMRHLHIMKDCVINMPISLGLQKNSPLKPRVDRFLRLITEAGLVKKWLNDAMAQVLMADRTEETDAPEALMNLKKLYGAFVALGVGYGLSTLALFLELLYWFVFYIRNPHFDRYSKTIIIAKKINK